MLNIDTTTWHTPNVSRHIKGTKKGEPIIITPQGILLHTTEGSALASLRWLTDPNSKVSCNYVVDEQGNIFQLAKDTERTWHGGPGVWDGINDLNTFLGIEIVHTKGQGVYPAVQVNAVLALCRAKIKEYGFPRSRVTLHRWAALPKGRKEDPTDLTDEQARIWIQRMYDAPWNLPNRRRYRVTTDANIRQNYTRQSPIAATLKQGDIFIADLMRFGENIGGRNGWLHDITGRGFVHESVLDEIEERL